MFKFQLVTQCCKCNTCMSCESRRACAQPSITGSPGAVVGHGRWSVLVGASYVGRVVHDEGWKVCGG